MTREIGYFINILPIVRNKFAGYLGYYKQLGKFRKIIIIMT